MIRFDSNSSFKPKPIFVLHLAWHDPQAQRVPPPSQGGVISEASISNAMQNALSEMEACPSLFACNTDPNLNPNPDLWDI